MLLDRNQEGTLTDAACTFKLAKTQSCQERA